MVTHLLGFQMYKSINFSLYKVIYFSVFIVWTCCEVIKKPERIHRSHKQIQRGGIKQHKPGKEL